MSVHTPARWLYDVGTLSGAGAGLVLLAGILSSRRSRHRPTRVYAPPAPVLTKGPDELDLTAMRGSFAGRVTGGRRQAH